METSKPPDAPPGFPSFAAVPQGTGVSASVQPATSDEKEYKRLLEEWNSLRARYRLAIQGVHALLADLPISRAYLRNRFVRLEADLGNEFRIDPPVTFSGTRLRRLRGKVRFLQSRDGVPLLEQTKIEIPRAIDADMFHAALPHSLNARSRLRLGQQFEQVPEPLRSSLARTIEHKQGLTTEDVSFAIERSRTLHPAPFSSDEAFSSALSKLQSAPSSKDQQTQRSIFPGPENRTLQILIHGSSVEGLRSKAKEGKGWRFDSGSDIDLTIIDIDRFLWAQAAGIPTRIGVKTVELNPIELKIVKLTKFVNNFTRHLQTLGITQPVNVCIYRDLDSALTHSGFSLLCQCPVDGPPVVTRIFSKGRDPFGQEIEKPDEKRLFLGEYFGPGLADAGKRSRVLPTSLEKPWPKKGEKHKLIRSTYDAIHEAIEQIADPSAFGHGKEKATPADEILAYLYKMIEDALRPLERLSRKKNPSIDHEFSSTISSLGASLFSQAIGNFKSCLATICTALRNQKTGLLLSQLTVPLQKSFVAILDCTIDTEVYELVENGEKHEAIEAAKEFLSKGKTESKRIFKAHLIELEKMLRG